MGSDVSARVFRFLPDARSGALKAKRVQENREHVDLTRLKDDVQALSIQDESVRTSDKY